MKIKDPIYAGAMAGLITGVIFDLCILILRLLGVNARTPWDDTASLMFTRQISHTLSENLIAFPVSLLFPMTGGVILCLVLKRFGRDYLFFKGIFLSELATFFMLVVVYPALGYTLLKHTVATYWAALLGMVPFGMLLTFVVKRLTDFEEGS